MKCSVCGKSFAPKIPDFNLFSADCERKNFCSNTCQAIHDIKRGNVKINPDSRIARRMKEMEEDNGKVNSPT